MKSNFKDNFTGLPILITGHVNPDGDAIGSALALKLSKVQRTEKG